MGYIITIINCISCYWRSASDDKGIKVNMSTVDNMSIFSFSYVCDVVVIYGLALMLLAAMMKPYGCSVIGAVILLVHFFQNLD